VGQSDVKYCASNFSSPWLYLHSLIAQVYHGRRRERSFFIQYPYRSSCWHTWSLRDTWRQHWKQDWLRDAGVSSKASQQKSYFKSGSLVCNIRGLKYKWTIF
jgi:hypothetical protein